MRSILAIALALASFALVGCSGADVGHIDPVSAPETDAERGPVRGVALPEGDGGGAQEASAVTAPDAAEAATAPDAGRGDGAVACSGSIFAPPISDCPPSVHTGTGFEFCDVLKGVCFDPTPSPASLIPQGCRSLPVVEACPIAPASRLAPAYEAISCDPSVLFTHVGDKPCGPADPSLQPDGGATLYCCHF